MSDSNFTWLHISDLHFGLAGQKSLWPTFKHQFYDDLRQLTHRTGPIDLVIFSGDITQSGSAEQYVEATKVLNELLAVLEALGSTPKLFVVPGNHDLVRADEHDPNVIVLEQWFSQASIETRFFSAKDQRYWNAVDNAFSNYRNWKSSAALPFAPSSDGLLPGDQAATMQVGSMSIGVVGFNSTWLQLTKNNAEERLNVDLEQMSALLPDAEEWCRRNDLNLIVTHHPTGWLHEAARKNWRSDISPVGRFDLHLFGHMHETVFTSLAMGTGKPHLMLQARSLFGLEKLANMQTLRSHGYSIGQVGSVGGSRSLEVWPRVLSEVQDGRRIMIPDYSFELNDNQSIVVALPARPAKVPIPQPRVTEFSPLSDDIRDGESVLAPALYRLAAAPAHLGVRLVEQFQFRQSIQQTRGAWLISEWGLGADEFLWSALTKEQRSEYPTFRLEVSSFNVRQDLIDRIAALFGCNLERLCEYLAEIGPANLVLDDVPVGLDRPLGAPSVEEDIEYLLRAILEYCSELTIVVRSRRRPASASFRVHQLDALDEADVGAYLQSHPMGGAGLTKEATVGTIYRLTDGVPSRIDVSLSQLKVVSLAELSASTVDFGRAEVEAGVAPGALQEAIGELTAGQDVSLRKSFDLLRTLAAFPYGVEFGFIKRFYGALPFSPEHAAELERRDLISVSESNDIAVGPEQERVKLLMVPRPVRDHLRSTMSEEEISDLNSRVAELFFGPEWRTGTPKWPTSLNYSDPRCSTSKIANASAILLRLFKLAIDVGNEHEIGCLVALSTSYCKALQSGDHFHSLVSFARDMLPLLDTSKHEAQSNMIKYRCACALRMTGDFEAALPMLESLQDKLPKSMTAGLLMDLALGHYSRDNKVEARRYATQALAAKRHGRAALQAQSILIQTDDDEASRLERLEALEATARKKGAVVTANNIAITRAYSTEDFDLSSSILDGVIKSGARDKDFYNSVRAIVKVARKRFSQNGDLSDAEMIRLIHCYQFLFNERIGSLFFLCHSVLFDVFLKRTDWRNLFSLFRYSSLRWRLQGDTEAEGIYIDRLRIAAVPPDLQDRATEYFMTRSGTGQLGLPNK